MKTNATLLFVILWNATHLLGQNYPDALSRPKYSKSEKALDLKMEKNEKGDVRVLRLKELGATLPPLVQKAPKPGENIKDTPLLGQIVDVKLSGSSLAIVQDWGGISFVHQLYEIQEGNWVLKSQKLFFALRTDRQQSLCLVRLESLDKVRITMLKKGQTFTTPIQPGSAIPLRTPGVTEEGDPSFLFEFKADGSILRDGHPYKSGGND